MSFFKTFFQLFAYLPKLMDSMKLLLDWLDEQITAAEKRKKIQAMIDALAQAKQTKDTSKVDQIFDPK